MPRGLPIPGSGPARAGMANAFAPGTTLASLMAAQGGAAGMLMAQSAMAAGQSRSSHVRPGDWTCPGCMSNCYASKTACFRCSHPRPLGVGGGGVSGGGSTRPGDWTCSQCKANVYASKTSCFRCGAAKLATVVTVPVFQRGGE